VKPRVAPPNDDSTRAAGVGEEARAQGGAIAAHETGDHGEHEFKDGDVCGDWKIERFVAEGGMGEVYKVCTVIGGKRGALKRVRPQYAARADLGERFETEIRILAELDHPYIVGLLHAGMHNGSPYFVMEWLDGVTLRDVLNCRRQPFSPAEALSYIIRVAAALCAAHAVGILHRDLKPENIFMLKKGKLKVLDFGLGKLIEGRRARTSERLVGMCTVHYAAPEQLDRSTSVDERTDVYALALIFVEMVTLLWAFADMPGVLPPKEVAQANQLFAQPHSLRKVPGCRPSLADLIEAALSKDKERRPRSAEFLAGLRAEYRALQDAGQSMAGTNIDDEDSSDEQASPPPDTEAVHNDSAVRIIPFPLRTATLPPNQPPPDPTAAGNPVPPRVRTIKMSAPRAEDLEAARRAEATRRAAERANASDATGDTTGSGRSATLPPDPGALRSAMTAPSHDGGGSPVAPAWAGPVPPVLLAATSLMQTPHDPAPRIHDEAAARTSVEFATRPTLPWQRQPAGQDGTPSLTPTNRPLAAAENASPPRRIPIWAGPVLGVAATLAVFVLVKLVPSRVPDSQSAPTAPPSSASAGPTVTARSTATPTLPEASTPTGDPSTAAVEVPPAASATAGPTVAPTRATAAPRAQSGKPKALPQEPTVEKDDPFILKQKPEPLAAPAKSRLFGLETDDNPAAPAPKPSAPKPSAPKPPAPKALF
jgi:serine/threonine protein kinase